MVRIVSRTPDPPIPRFPDSPITRSPDHPITRSPDHPITRSPDLNRYLCPILGAILLELHCRFALYKASASKSALIKFLSKEILHGHLCVERAPDVWPGVAAHQAVQRRPKRDDQLQPASQKRSFASEAGALLRRRRQTGRP